MNAHSWKHSAPSRLDDLESAEKARLVQLYRKLGFKVYSLSQNRPTRQTAGLPDLLAKHGPRKLSFTQETKAKAGRVSKAQQEFADLSQACGDLHVIGGYEAGVKFLQAHGVIPWAWRP